MMPGLYPLQEVCGWINAKATVPVWAKMTPNVTDITQPARVALEAGEPHSLRHFESSKMSMVT